jgi:hypothetical protein
LFVTSLNTLIPGTPISGAATASGTAEKWCVPGLGPAGAAGLRDLRRVRPGLLDLRLRGILINVPTSALTGEGKPSRSGAGG